ncbi:MAG TPA: ChbG/HpnK family deacetylase [Chthoniobacterales bacterium]|nr:ChbG/HpnK family deacetylase [Chthoniobacterales bacterium]
MIIINADDWGRSCSETDAALTCFLKGTITSVSAMVFMKDSRRAAVLAKEAGLAVGLHLNLNEAFTGSGAPKRLVECQRCIARFLNGSKYSRALYHPLLTNKLDFVFQAQLEEFIQLYGTVPSHLDGHHHLHLCSNMLIGRVLPRGLKIRRTFSFWPGEKGPLKLAYYDAVNRWLRCRYVVTDYFFSLGQCLATQHMEQVLCLAGQSSVELMTHPTVLAEYRFLQSDECLKWLEQMRRGSYAELGSQLANPLARNGTS